MGRAETPLCSRGYGIWGGISTPNQLSTSDGDDPFVETALNRGSAWSWGDSDEPFLSQISYNHAKLFLIGLEIPENKHLHPL